MWLAIGLFLLGVIEYIVITQWTNAVASRRPLQASGIVFLYILLWYAAVTQVLLGTFLLACIYGLGCATGTYITCKSESGSSLLDRLLRRRKKEV